MCIWRKEVRYFSIPNATKAGVDLCWYRRRYPCRAGRVGLDASPDYFLLDDQRVANMAHALPLSARLVFLLRNPAERFYSAFNMASSSKRGIFSDWLSKAVARHAGLSAPSQSAESHAQTVLPRHRAHELRYKAFVRLLDAWLECAPQCPREGGSPVNLFFSYGLYASGLARFAASFGWERMLVIKSEDFFADNWAIVQRVVRHAGLPEPPELEAKVRAGVRHSAAINNGSIYGGSTRVRLLAPELRKLCNWYRPHNQLLYAMEGVHRDFGWEAECDARSLHLRSPSILHVGRIHGSVR